MKRFIPAILLLAALVISVSVRADVEDVRVWQSPDKTRLVFDLSRAHQHKIFTLSNPDRVVIDLVNASNKANLDGLIPVQPVSAVCVPAPAIKPTCAW